MLVFVHEMTSSSPLMLSHYFNLHTTNLQKLMTE